MVQVGVIHLTPVGTHNNVLLAAVVRTPGDLGHGGGAGRAPRPRGGVALVLRVLAPLGKLGVLPPLGKLGVLAPLRELGIELGVWVSLLHVRVVQGGWVAQVGRTGVVAGTYTHDHEKNIFVLLVLLAKNNRLYNVKLLCRMIKKKILKS